LKLLNKRKGFLLVEILIALSLFTLFALFISKYQSLCLKLNEHAFKRAQALNISLSYYQNSVMNKGKEGNRNSKFDISVKNLSCSVELQNIHFSLKTILGDKCIFDLKDFKLVETIVAFNLLDGKRGEVKIKTGL